MVCSELQIFGARLGHGMAKLTVRTIDSAKPKTTAYKLTVDRGLYLRVAPNGVKRWLVRYQINDDRLEVRLPMPYGNGPGFMSLADATAENSRIQSLARSNIDFQEVEREVREEKQRLLSTAQNELRTFTEMYAAWLEDGVARKDGNRAIRRAFEADVIPQLGTTPVKDITVTQVRNMLRTVAKRGVNRTVVSLLTDLRQLFRWGQAEQPWRRLLIEGDPTNSVKIETIVASDYDLSNQRDRTLCPDEIRELHDIFVRTGKSYADASDKRIAERPLSVVSQIGIWICLSTLCRVGELLMAEWEHVDLDKRQWFIPEENVKGTRGKKQSQLVYLSDFALAQFTALQKLTNHSKWCFPARNNEGHVDLTILSKQVGDRQIMFKGRKNLKGRRNDNSLVLAGGVNGDWKPHDMRRTGATMMQGLKIPHDVIDRCQNHVIAGSRVRRHYMHYEYLQEKQDAWTRLGAALENILQADNLLVFPQKQRA